MRALLFLLGIYQQVESIIQCLSALQNSVDDIFEIALKMNNLKIKIDRILVLATWIRSYGELVLF
jgi:hypothetical protein